MSQTGCRLAMLAGHGPYQPLLRAPGDCLRSAARKILPATASSFFRSFGSRASGAVISAASGARSGPMGLGSCSRGKSRASRATNVASPT